MKLEKPTKIYLKYDFISAFNQVRLLLFSNLNLSIKIIVWVGLQFIMMMDYSDSMKFICMVSFLILFPFLLFLSFYLSKYRYKVNTVILEFKEDQLETEFGSHRRIVKYSDIRSYRHHNLSLILNIRPNSFVIMFDDRDQKNQVLDILNSMKIPEVNKINYLSVLANIIVVILILLALLTQSIYTFIEFV